MHDQRVAIIGYALIGFNDEIEGLGDEVVFTVTKQALDDAGIGIEQVDSVVITTMDSADGITISNGLLVPAAGAFEKDSVRVQNGGVFGILSGVASILSEHANCAVIASADVAISDFAYSTNMSFDPFLRRPVGMNHVTSFGLLSGAYVKKYGYSELDLAEIAVKDYAAAIKNKHAHRKEAWTTEEILASPLISWPLRKYELAPFSTGAAAVILASETFVKQIGISNPVWIEGYGMKSQPYFGDWEDNMSLPALRKAAEKAYGIAGITEPSVQIDAAELCAPFVTAEPIACEALGFCGKGEGVDFRKNGRIAVNSSGGTISTSPFNSGGLLRTIEVAMEINNGTLPESSKPKFGLVHDSDWGIGCFGESHAVLILKGAE